MDFTDAESRVADWWGLSYAQTLEAEAEAGIRAVDFGGILLVTDPNGNVVELQKIE